MTKEELEKEAEERYHNHKLMDFQGFYKYQYYSLGYVEGAESREKRIAELEKENKDIKALRKYEGSVASAEIEKLQEENAELLCQKNRNKSCYSCANATERCFRNEIGCPCQKYKSYKEEIADQLTKAKEIIRKLLLIIREDEVKVYNMFVRQNIIELAEDFIKE